MVAQPLFENQATPRNVAALVNGKAGDAQFWQDAQARLGRHAAPVRLTASYDIAALGVEDAVAQALGDAPDAVLIAGGDGTIRAVVEAFDKRPVPLVALPCGTMNLLAKRLTGGRDAAEIIDALPAARRVTVPGGSVNGHPFLLSAAFGFPVTMAEAREAWRAEEMAALPDAFGLASRALEEAGQALVEIRLSDGTQQKTAAVIAIPGHYSTPTARLQGHEEFDHLACAFMGEHGAVGWLRMAMTSLASDWWQDGQFEKMTADHFEVSVAKPIMALLDGEPMSFDNPMQVRFEPCLAQFAMLPPVAVTAA